MIDRWLKCWPELCARAEHLRSPSAYDVSRPAPTRGRFSHGSALEIMADIERAHAQFHRASILWLVVDYRKRGVGSLGMIARTMGRRKDDVLQTYRAALDAMVEFLNGGGRGPG